MVIDLTNQEKNIEITEDLEIVSIYSGEKNTELKSKLVFVHKNPNIKSRINFKAVVLQNARVDIECILRIEKGAVGTDSYLKIDCLVIGDNAYARAIPSLEINESEVKGGHGATIGYIDPEQLYYLKSRGLKKSEAEEMIVKAFVNNSNPK